MTQDFYKILGVDKNASDDDIKKAYRTLVKEYHPDLNSSPEAAEKIKLINQAYEVLSDPAKRVKYDNTRQPFGFPSFEDLFSGFGGFNNFRTARYEFSQTVRLPFYELILGCEIEVTFNREKIKFIVPKFSQNGSRVTVNDGNKYYHLNLVAVLPNNLTEDKLELIKKLKEIK